MNTPNRFERRKQHTRQQLKQAGIALVLEKGYDALTIQDITDRADVARATFYLYYKDKEEIVWEAIQEQWDVVVRELRKHFSVYQVFDEYPGLIASFQLVAAQREFYKIVFGSRGSAALIRRKEAYLAAAIEHEIKHQKLQTSFSHLPPEIVAQFIIGAGVRLMVWWIETPNDYSVEQMASMIYAMLHPALPTAETPLKKTVNQNSSSSSSSSSR